MSGDTDGFRFSGVDDLLQSTYWNFFPVLVYIGFCVEHTRDV